MCNFFVSDEPPVPSWRLTPPLHPDLVQALERTYFESGYDIAAMLRVLFTSKEFKSESVRYSKVKSPAEMAVGALRLAGEHREVKPGLFDVSLEPKYMGMDLMNPPTVEGWHTGREWIDSGTLVERINFTSDLLGNTELPGVRSMIQRLKASGLSLSPEALVDGCLDVIGPLPVHEETRGELLAHAHRGGEVRHGSPTEEAEFTRRAGEMLQMIASTAEYQFG